MDDNIRRLLSKPTPVDYESMYMQLEEMRRALRAQVSDVPVIYIAGPFRAPNSWLREKNIREAEELAFRVAECGAQPLCPHTNTRHFDGTLHDEFWLSGALALLAKCDAAVFAKRWMESDGTRAENDFCRKYDITFFGEAHIPEDLTEWVKDWKQWHTQLKFSPTVSAQTV